MALKEADRVRVVKEARATGHVMSSDRTQLIDKKGSRIKFSSSGGSVDVNGQTCTTGSDASRAIKS
jgi:hypothetical protein